MAKENRAAARLAAVQALYEMDLAGKGLHEIFAEFETFWMGQEIEGDQYIEAETEHFRNVVEGVLQDQTALDRQIDTTLQSGWPLRRVEAVLRAILRAGAYELKARRDIPVRVIIKEYVDVAAAFLASDEVGMANAVLDSVGRGFRPDDFEGMPARRQRG